MFLLQIANAIPILSQADLDQAIEILDRSQHLTSLRILLSLPNGVTENAGHHSMKANSSMLPPSNPKVGSFFGIASKPFYVSDWILISYSVLTRQWPCGIPTRKSEMVHKEEEDAPSWAQGHATSQTDFRTSTVK